MPFAEKKPVLISAVVASLVVLYYLDALCVLRGGEVYMQSHGEEVLGGLVIRNGCTVHHLAPKGGIHVVGVGRMGIDSTHVGYIEDFNRIEKLEEIESKLTAMGKKYRFVGMVTDGGTHHKPALARIRDDVAIQINAPVEASEFSLVDFFKKYDLGKFLSVEHGCCIGYLTLYDTAMKQKVVEKIGAIRSKLEHTVTI